jgi:hypothetical protein
MQDVYTAYEQLRGAVLASEEWPDDYKDAPTQFGRMLRLTGRLERQVLQHLKAMADSASKFVNWDHYKAVSAFNVDVIINDSNVQDANAGFLTIIFDTAADIAAQGVQSMDPASTVVPLGLDSTSTLIQQLTTDNLAALVGKKVDPFSGRLIDNPNAKYAITDTTRDRIAQSIKTSLRLGENKADAIARLRTVIANPARASMIAVTEGARAYNSGRFLYAQQSGATGKKWRTIDATDVCADNAAEGFIPLDQAFANGSMMVPAHPHCKCIVVYTYQPRSDW